MQDQFPNARNVCYLNSASEGLLPASAYRALEAAAQLKQTPQLLGDPQYFEMPRRCRSLLAQLLHCHDREIALINSTNFGIAAVAHSLPLKPGDEILLVEKDFPSNNLTWHAFSERGMKVRYVPFMADRDQTMRVIEAITPQTRVLGISWVHFYTGYRYDMAAISEACTRNDALLIVDAIQAAGCIEIDLEKIRIDAMIAAAHKWQLSPSGVGFLYINKELLPRLNTAFTGWMHNADATTFRNTVMFEYQPSSQARRFELGTAPYVLLSAYEESLKVLAECKIPYIEQHNRQLVQHCQKRFQELGWDTFDIPVFAGICAVRPPAKYDPRALLSKLAEQNVFPAVREEHFRVSPHFYNSIQDIDRLHDALREIL